MPFEHRTQPVLTRRRFMQRLARHGIYGLGLLSVSLALGITGYRWFAGFTWVDSLLNASMLLGGMGPVGDLPNDAAKIFASLYALYAGVVFLVLTGLLLAPVFHRVLHRFHWEADHQRQGK
jgi:hypothetical protein